MTRSGKRRPRRGAGERLFETACLLAAVLPVSFLAALLVRMVVLGRPRLELDFLLGYPSRFPELAGILPGLVGTLWLMLITAGVALPVGVGAAIYLEEYGGRGRLARMAELNISNLAGVPSIIYGLLGLEVFVRTIGMGRSLLAGGLTLSLLVLPIVIITAREALRSVPGELREAGLALGGTRWRVTRQIVLPNALPGILTGSIFATSRAIGEAAPLLILGGVVYVDFLPSGPGSPFTALPIQIFNWVSRPQPGFVVDASAGILVLLVILVLLNAFAVGLRTRMRARLARGGAR